MCWPHVFNFKFVGYRSLWLLIYIFNAERYQMAAANKNVFQIKGNKTIFMITYNLYLS